MTERMPCPVCSWTQMCNCDVQAEALTELPGEDLSALDDTKFVAALEGMGVEKAPPWGMHFGVSNEWQTLALPSGYWASWSSGDIVSALDAIERQYLARPAEKQIARAVPEPGYAWPEPSAETLAEFAKFIETGRRADYQRYAAKVAALEKERIRHESEEAALDAMLDRLKHDPGALLNPESEPFSSTRYWADKAREAARLMHEDDERYCRGRAAEAEHCERSQVANSFRKVGSRDWWAGKEEGAPSPEPFFTGDPQALEKERQRSELQKPFNEMFYRSFLITGISGEMPKAQAPALIRHLGESEEQVSMLLAQMSAPLGSCTCQRINGFLFACLACSKAGKA